MNREFGYCTLLPAMFTGIVQELGLVRSVRSDALTLDLAPSFRECLIVGGSAAIIPETYEKTVLRN